MYVSTMSLWESAMALKIGCSSFTGKILNRKWLVPLLVGSASELKELRLKIGRYDHVPCPFYTWRIAWRQVSKKAVLGSISLVASLAKW